MDRARLLEELCSDRIYWADHERWYKLTESEYADFNTFVAKVALRS